MALFLKLLTIVHLVVVASSEPTISFPFNAQLPPVARIDEPFSYTFSSYTFRSDSSMSYSLGDSPKWLSIDSSDGRLYGTPKDDDVPAGDIVGQFVELIAKDETGQTSLNATLVVSRMKAPSVGIPISEQISNFGDYSTPSSLLSYPSTEFTYTFDPNTFDYQPNMINYYATSADSSPLPAWIKFDGPALTFSGTTPPIESLIQPPQHFGFRLVASDVVGFSAVDIDFSIVVGSHKLSTDQPTVELNATQGKRLSYNGLSDSIKLDNNSITSGDVNVSSEGMPDWLSLDNESWEIKGTPEKGDRSTNFTINFRDIYEDSLTVQFIVNVATGLFRSTLDDISIKAGQNVSIDLQPYFWEPEDTEITLILQPKKDWLELDGFNITGKVPISASGKLNMTIVASSKSSDLKETESLNLDIIATTPTSTSSSTSTTSRASSSQTATSTKTESSQPSDTSSSADTAVPTTERSGLSTGELLLAIILPILFVAILLMLLICWCIRRRRARRTYLSSNFRDKISGPVLDSLRINGHAPQMQEADSTHNLGRSGSRPGMYGHSEFGSQPSTMLSPSYGSLATPEIPSSYLAEDSRGRMAPTMSMPTIEEARQSWITVEDNVGAAGRHSQVSSRSGQSDTTFPESTHQLLPAPGFLSDSGGSSFRNGLELTIPSIDDLPNLQQRNLNQAQYSQTPGGPGDFSGSINSSLAFPSSHQSSPRLVTGLFGERTVAPGEHNRPVSRANVPLLQSSSDSIPEMARPSPARLSTQQRHSRPESRAWYDTDSSSGPRSMHTDPSFGPSENWRVIASSHRNVGSISYHELVDSAPFHPNRPNSVVSNNHQGGLGLGGGLGDRASSELISPSQWGDSKTSLRGSFASRRELFSRSVSGYSRLNASASGNWRREDSGRRSEGGSIKAFL